MQAGDRRIERVDAQPDQHPIAMLLDRIEAIEPAVGGSQPHLRRAD